VFLTKASNVWTCGSNQFGQLGLQSDAVFMDDNDQAQGGSDVHMTPIAIEKSVLDHVVYIAAGRYHTIAVRK
jgi:alpha-tubulin suppressor-like RCC1 family protein